MHETFWDLIRDAAHWEFELFLMLVVDGLIVGVGWRYLCLHWRKSRGCEHDQRGSLTKLTAGEVPKNPDGGGYAGIDPVQPPMDWFLFQSAYKPTPHTDPKTFAELCEEERKMRADRQHLCTHIDKYGRSAVIDGYCLLCALHPAAPDWSMNAKAIQAGPGTRPYDWNYIGTVQHVRDYESADPDAAV